MSDEDHHHRPGLMARMRNYFLTGFIVVAPLAITVWLIWNLVQWIDSWIIPYLPPEYDPHEYLPFAVPGIGLILAFLGISFIGFLTATIVGRTIVSLGEEALDRLPVVRNLYNGLKQIFETAFSNQSGSFRSVGLIQYPRKGLWAMVFIAAEAKGEVEGRLKEGNGETVAVFLPTTPNPTSGFLLFVPRSDVVILDMGVEDAAKLIISAGLVTPSHESDEDEGE